MEENKTPVQPEQEQAAPTQEAVPAEPAAETPPKAEKKAKKKTDPAELEAKLEAAQKELADTKEQYQRMLAIRQLQTPHRAGKGADRRLHQGGAAQGAAYQPGQYGKGGGR